MPYSLLGTLLLQILVVGYTPGPANIYALTMSLRHDRREALVMWTGLLTGFSIGAFGLALLTHFVGTAFGSYLYLLKYLGAAYIFYLAVRLLRPRRETAGTRDDCTFRSGLLVQLTNAKMLLFDLTAFSVFVLPYSYDLADLFEVSAWLLIAGPGANLAWLLAGSFLKRFFIHHGKLIDRCSALALALCAIYVLIG